MKKLMILIVLSLLMVFGLTSNAFASISVYPDFSTDSNYPVTLLLGPASLNTSVMSDSEVGNVTFIVYKEGSNQTDPYLTVSANSGYPGQSWWTATLDDVDWTPGDYRLVTEAVNASGETAVQSSYFKIQAENVLRGSIVTWSGSPMKYTSVYFHLAGQDAWSGYSGWADEYGRFSVPGLASGTYQVSAYNNSGLVNLGTVTVNLNDSMVTVSEATGNVSINGDKLVITMLKPKVTGRLIRGGVGFANANISIKREGSDYDYYWAVTDSKGYFGLDLVDGNYVITEVSTYKTPGDYRRIELNQTFAVADITDLGNMVVPDNNLIGGLVGLKAPAYGSPESYYGINLTFINTEAGENQTNKYYWTRAVWDKVLGQYTFTLYLPSGTYRTEAYVSGQQMDFSGEYFVVSGMDNTNITTSPENKMLTMDSGKLNISVPQNNVSGTLQDANGNPMSYAGITIRKADAVVDDWSAYKWIGADENGKFSLYLQDGNYIITQIYHNGNMTSPNQQFVVSGITEVDVTVPQ